MYALVVDGVIKQTQNRYREGLVVVPDNSVAGMLWDGNELSIPDKTIEQIEEEFRDERDRLLAGTDFMMTIDYYGSLTTAQQEEVTTYRQALRDSTNDFVMPVKPEWIEG